MNYERFEAATDFKVFDLLIFFSSASFLFVFLLAEREVTAESGRRKVSRMGSTSQFGSTAENGMWYELT